MMKFGDLRHEQVGRGQVPEAVRDALVVARVAAGVDETRRIFSHVFWGRLGKRKHLVVASDTYRMVWHEVEAEVKGHHAAPTVGCYWLLDAQALRAAFATAALRRDGELYITRADADETVAVTQHPYPYGRQTVTQEPAAYALVTSARGSKTRRAPALTAGDDPRFPNCARIWPEGEPAWSADMIDAEQLAADARDLAKFGGDENRVRLHGNEGLYLSAHGEQRTARTELTVGAHDGEAVVWGNGEYLSLWAGAVAEVYPKGHDRPGQLTAAFRAPLEPMVWRDLVGGGSYVLMPMQGPKGVATDARV